MIRVKLPSILASYTGAKSEMRIESASTLSALADRLEESCPGIRFRIIDEHNRIRRHIQFFVNGEMVTDIGAQLRDGDEVQIVGALSGG